MKKLLSILGVCEIVSMSANLTACDKPNDNENGNGNKPEPKPEKPQEPPVGSKWKLIDKKDYDSFVSNIDNKFYFFVFKSSNGKWKLLKFKHDTHNAKEIDGIPFIPSDIKVYAEAGRLKGLYQWNGLNEPLIPEFDKNTGKITVWKE